MDPQRKAQLEARAAVFKAMGHPSRLALIDELARGELCVCDLNRVIDADMSTVSRHLGVLRNAGILASEKRGNQIFYSLRVPCVTNFYACVERALPNTAMPIQIGAKR